MCKIFFSNKYREARVATYDDEKIQLNILASVLVKRVRHHGFTAWKSVPQKSYWEMVRWWECGEVGPRVRVHVLAVDAPLAVRTTTSSSVLSCRNE